MNFDSTTMFHAIYVTFVFACMFFGALAFRQILDNIAVRAMKMGENRMYFLHAPGIMFVLAGTSVSFILAILSWYAKEPTVYLYALPLILLAQILQIGLRLYFQRLQITTLGFVYRPIFFEKQRATLFHDVLHVHVHKQWLYTRITLYANTPEPLVFRIFPFSWHEMQRVLRVSCTCPIED